MPLLELVLLLAPGSTPQRYAYPALPLLRSKLDIAAYRSSSAAATLFRADCRAAGSKHDQVIEVCKNGFGCISLGRGRSHRVAHGPPSFLRKILGLQMSMSQLLHLHVPRLSFSLPPDNRSCPMMVCLVSGRTRLSLFAVAACVPYLIRSLSRRPNLHGIHPEAPRPPGRVRICFARPSRRLLSPPDLLHTFDLGAVPSIERPRFDLPDRKHAS